MRLRGFYLSSLSLLFLSVSLYAQQCQPPVMSGVWNADDTAQYTLTEHPDGTVTGTVSAKDTCVQDAPVYGFSDHANQTYTGFVDLSRTSCANASWIDEAPLPQLPSCNQARGTYYTSTGAEAPFFWSKLCDVPTDETSTIDHWLAPILPTILRFNVALSSTRQPASKWGGRLVSERFYKEGFDSCYYDGSIVDDQKFGPNVALLKDFPIDPADQSYLDDIGWEEDAVRKYRNNYPTTGPEANRLRVPCGVILYQSMGMTCEADLRIPFKFNVVSASIEAQTVQSCRDGLCDSKVFITSVAAPPPIADVIEGGRTTPGVVAGAGKPRPLSPPASDPGPPPAGPDETNDDAISGGRP